MVEAFPETGRHCNLAGFRADAGSAWKKAPARKPFGVSVCVENRQLFCPWKTRAAIISHLPCPGTARADAPLASKADQSWPCCPREGKNDRICIHYGNPIIALIHPDWREMDDSLDAMPVHVDGRDDITPFGQGSMFPESVRGQASPRLSGTLTGHDSGKADEKRQDSAPRAGTLDIAALFGRQKRPPFTARKSIRGKKFRYVLLRFGQARPA